MDQKHPRSPGTLSNASRNRRHLSAARIEQIVGGKGGSDVSALAGTPVRLRFVMKDTDLYSMRFK